MKLFIVAIVAVFVGLMLGRIGPQSEMRELEKQLAEKSVDETPRRSLMPLSGLLAIPGVLDQLEDSKTKAVVAESDVPVSGISIEADEVPASENEAEDDDRSTLERQIEAAAALWSVRASLARSGFVASVGLEEDGAAQFDVIVAAMNIRMKESFEEWAVTLAETDMPPAEIGVRMVNDLSEVVTLAYEDLDRSMPTGWRKRGGETFNVGDFIDPVVAVPLLSVEDKLQSLGGRRGR